MLDLAIVGVKLALGGYISLLGGLPYHLLVSDCCWNPVVPGIASVGGLFNGLCDTRAQGTVLFEYPKLPLDAVGIFWGICPMKSSCGTILDALPVSEPDSLIGLVASLLIKLSGLASGTWPYSPILV